MTPGLAGGPPFPQKAGRNAIVAIASLERPTVPMVVGITEIDISTLVQVHGSKGHAVRSEHWVGDELWAWSSTGKPGMQAPSELLVSSEGPREANPELALAQMSLDEDEELEGGGVALEDSASSSKKAALTNEHVHGEDPEPFETVDEPDMTTKGKCAWKQGDKKTE